MQVADKTLAGATDAAEEALATARAQAEADLAKAHEAAESEGGIKITVVSDNALSAAGEIKQAQEKAEKAA